MSMPAVGFAFSQRLPATQKWLLVCLANYADDWGDSIFASLEELTDCSGLSRATLQRTFRDLLKSGILTRVARSTPSSPPFYRIVGMPEPEPRVRRERDCPNALRTAVKHAFQHHCEYCHEGGTPDKGPDGHRWTVDRLIPGKQGGRYVPDNVTLACRRCNTKKGLGGAPVATRSLAMMTGQPVGPQNEAPISAGVGHQDDASRVSPRGVGGLTLTPDPCIDPVTDPSEEKAGAAPLLTFRKDENPNDNVGVITKLAHEVLDLYEDSQERITLGEIAESVKLRCATLDITYNSDVVGRAIDSATIQRARVGKPFVVPELRAVRIS